MSELAERREVLMPRVSTDTLGRDAACEIQGFDSVRWAWAVRSPVEASGGKHWLLLERGDPRVGDLAMVRVERVGHHRHLETMGEGRIRLYPGDHIIGVFGNRYATDVFEGRVLDLEKLHLLSASGLIGTVVSRNHEVSRPTTVSFVGYLGGGSRHRMNLKEIRFQGQGSSRTPPYIVLVVGTGMSTGKTTVVRKILRGLASSGIQVAGCKLTGSASPRDLNEMRATGAVLATDFSDYGFPSTSGAALEELIQLLNLMSDACARERAQWLVVEIADGFLQPETQLLLESAEIRRRVKGVVIAGACSGSLLSGTEYVQSLGLEVWAASGLVTNSPLFVREFSARSRVPTASSRGSARDLVRILLTKMDEVGTSRACAQSGAL